MNELLKETCKRLVDLSLAQGADECDVILNKGESLSLSAQDGDIDKYKVSGSQVVGVRVIKDSKIGLSYSESFDDDALKFCAQSAVENAKNAEVNEFESISSSDAQHIHPAQYKKDNTTIQDKIDFCLSLESEVKKRDPNVKAVPYNGVSETQRESLYLNSKNVFGYEQDYYQSCYTSALIEKNAKSSSHFQSSIGRSLSELDKDQCISESLLHANNWLEASAIPTGKYDVVFDPDAFAQLFGCFSNIFSGKGAMLKNNPFGDKVGVKVASSKLTVSDLPNFDQAFSSYFFDSEGIKHKDLILIEDGVLKSFYHNSVSAKFFNLESTAHAARGAKSSLGVSGTTKVISAGDVSMSDLNSGEYLEILSMQGLHSGSSNISGEFSFAASGYLCKDGKRAKAVKGVTVSGNYFKMLLGADIIGDEVFATTGRDFFAPKIRFEAVSIAGD